MVQKFHEYGLKYQEFLILAYFKANYKKYEFNDIVKMMGMTYTEMQSAIEHMLELKYLVCIENNIVISKIGEEVLEEKNLSRFFDNKKKEVVNKKQWGIDDIYIPIEFKV